MDKIFIYVIASDLNGPCKIGYTSDLDRRLRELQTAHPKQLKVFHHQEFTNKQAKLMERIIHKNLRYDRSYGEWFSISVEKAILEVDYSVIRYGDEPNLRNYL